MTRYLLENVFGSSDLDTTKKPKVENESVIDEIGYLPSVYMIRRLVGRDDISFKLFRYARAVEGLHTASHGLIEIELIESGHASGGCISSQSIKDADKQLLSRLDNEIKINADLVYSKVSNNKNSQHEKISIPHGQLYARASQQTAVISEQTHVNKPVSPVVYSAVLDCELAEDLWSSFEQEDVTLELSIHWLLTGEERGVPFQHVITQVIPIDISMAAQRNCFHKYETWADFEHDYSELHIQCFSLFKNTNSGLSNVVVATDLKDADTTISTQIVEFNQLDSESTKTILFPESAKLLKPSFSVTTTYYFDDGTSKEVASWSHQLRYYDASLESISD